LLELQFQKEKKKKPPKIKEKVKSNLKKAALFDRMHFK
jgi:hypothetical protein